MVPQPPHRRTGICPHLTVFGYAALFGLGAYAVIQLLIYAARLAGLH